MIMEVERTAKADNGKNLIPSRSLSENNACMPCKFLPDEGSFDSPYNQLSKITMQRVL